MMNQDNVDKRSEAETEEFHELSEAYIDQTKCEEAFDLFDIGQYKDVTVLLGDLIKMTNMFIELSTKDIHSARNLSTTMLTSRQTMFFQTKVQRAQKSGAYRTYDDSDPQTYNSSEKIRFVEEYIECIKMIALSRKTLDDKTSIYLGEFLDKMRSVYSAKNPQKTKLDQTIPARGFLKLISEELTELHDYYAKHKNAKV